MRAYIAILFAATLAGCTTTNTAGGPAGYAGQARDIKPAAGHAIIAALGGGLVSNAGLTGAERSEALEAEYRALEYTPVGQAVVWGDLRGRHGEVRAAQPYRVGSQDCRQYTHTVVLGGQPVVGRGTACRNPNGSWSLLT